MGNKITVIELVCLKQLTDTSPTYLPQQLCYLKNARLKMCE